MFRSSWKRPVTTGVVRRRRNGLYAIERLEPRQLLATYYVSPTGSDSRSGTSAASAWKTIAKVNNSSFSPGDSILFEGGKVFADGLWFSKGGTATNPITIGSYGTGQATISPAAGESGFYAYNCGGIALKNLKVLGVGAATSTKSAVGFFNDLAGNVKLPRISVDQVEVTGCYRGLTVGGWNGSSGYDGVSITNVSAHHNRHVGILVYGPTFNPAAPTYAMTNVYIGHCQANNNDGDPTLLENHTGSGITLGSVNGGIVERSVAFENGINNQPSEGPVGIWAYDSTNVTIQYNESYNNRTGAGNDGDGFDLDQNVTNSVLQYNYSHGNDGAGYLICSGPGTRNSNNIVRYNISENDSRKRTYGAISTWGFVTGLQVYGNTVSMDPPTGTNTPMALRLVGTDHRIFNNLFVTTGGVTLVRYDVDASRNPLYDPAVDQNILLRGNAYWSSGGGFKITWGATTYTSFSSWLAANPAQERVAGAVVGRNVDPLLTSPGSGGTVGDADLLETSLGGYKLQPRSPLINAGQHPFALFGINPGSRDFYGTAIPRNGAFDIGADESLFIAPTLATPAASTPNPVTGKTASLSVLGADDGGEATLKYTWATLSRPAGSAAPSFSSNGTNAAKNTVATFSKEGSYLFRVTIQDASGLTVTSSVTVTVNRTLTRIAVAAAAPTVRRFGSVQFTATAYDQFDAALPTQPGFGWSVVPTPGVFVQSAMVWLVASAGGTISSTGRFTAGMRTGTATVRATAGGISGTAVVTIV
ncbi:MAG: hypothetical protein EBS56_04015 [Planctomycetia bacterium]|nr:hypothetical protein [Planctomycetia bacterium]